LSGGRNENAAGSVLISVGRNENSAGRVLISVGRNENSAGREFSFQEEKPPGTMPGGERCST
jgi:hypothetical protein